MLMLKAKSANYELTIEKTFDGYMLNVLNVKFNHITIKKVNGLRTFDVFTIFHKTFKNEKYTIYRNIKDDITEDFKESFKLPKIETIEKEVSIIQTSDPNRSKPTKNVKDFSSVHNNAKERRQLKKVNFDISPQKRDSKLDRNRKNRLKPNRVIKTKIRVYEFMSGEN